MGSGIKNLITIFQILKIFSPFMALIYLIVWVTGVFSGNIFSFLDKFFGLLPNLIENFLYIETNIAGNKITMGYVYAACFMIFLSFASKKVLVQLDKLRRIHENKELEKRLLAQKELRKMKEKRKKEKVFKRNVFFGLFEFKLDYFNYYGKYKNEAQELKKLKMEYCKMMAERLELKYPKIKFLIAEELYFMCDDFSVFSGVTRDIVKLFKGFLNIGDKKGIKTEMLLSYWAGDKKTNAKETYNILSRINRFNYVNKVVVASGIYFRYLEEHENDAFEFVPLGASKLMGVILDGVDLDINLYIVKESK